MKSRELMKHQEDKLENLQEPTQSWEKPPFVLSLIVRESEGTMTAPCTTG